MGGGGTDVAAYYEQYGGFWTSAAISKYVYVTVNSRHDNSFVIKHSKETQVVDSIDDITHDIIRESLRFLRFDKWENPLFNTRGLEMNIISDVQGKSGLGVSGAITVGFLHILHTLKGDTTVSQQQLAEEAYHVEHDLSGSSSTGKQDQYIATHGGITSFTVDTDGVVEAKPLKLSRHTLSELEDNIVLFGTRLVREETADEALRHVAEKLRDKKKESSTVEYLNQIMQIGMQQRDALLAGDPDIFGQLLDEHWEMKKKYSGETNPAISDAYNLAKEAGALGGKVIGASTQGAYMMFYCVEGKDKLRPIMDELNMIEIPWTFEFDGSRIIHYS